MNFIIRRAKIEDAFGIHQAHMQSIQMVCGPDYNREEIAAWGGREFRENERIAAIKNDYVWVVENNGEIVGYGHLKVGSSNYNGRAHILGLYFCPSALGKKLGHQMLIYMEEIARVRKVKSISLESTITALAFYKKHGFIEQGPQITVKVSGTPIRCHPMKKELQ